MGWDIVWKGTPHRKGQYWKGHIMRRDSVERDSTGNARTSLPDVSLL